MDGNKFTFEEEIIVSLFNQSQMINIKPEKDMLLMVFSHEAYGINMNMKLCRGQGTQDCHVLSQQEGNTELLTA